MIYTLWKSKNTTFAQVLAVSSSQAYCYKLLSSSSSSPVTCPSHQTLASKCLPLESDAATLHSSPKRFLPEGLDPSDNDNEYRLSIISHNLARLQILSPNRVIRVNVASSKLGYVIHFKSILQLSLKSYVCLQHVFLILRSPLLTIY